MLRRTLLTPIIVSLLLLGNPLTAYCAQTSSALIEKETALKIQELKNDYEEQKKKREEQKEEEIKEDFPELSQLLGLTEDESYPLHTLRRMKERLFSKSLETLRERKYELSNKNDKTPAENDEFKELKSILADIVSSTTSNGKIASLKIFLGELEGSLQGLVTKSLYLFEEKELLKLEKAKAKEYQAALVQLDKLIEVDNQEKGTYFKKENSILKEIYKELQRIYKKTNPLGTPITDKTAHISSRLCSSYSGFRQKNGIVCTDKRIRKLAKDLCSIYYLGGENPNFDATHCGQNKSSDSPLSSTPLGKKVIVAGSMLLSADNYRKKAQSDRNLYFYFKYPKKLKEIKDNMLSINGIIKKAQNVPQKQVGADEKELYLSSRKDSEEGILTLWKSIPKNIEKNDEYSDNKFHNIRTQFCSNESQGFEKNKSIACYANDWDKFRETFCNNFFSDLQAVTREGRELLQPIYCKVNLPIEKEGGTIEINDPFYGANIKIKTQGALLDFADNFIEFLKNNNSHSFTKHFPYLATIRSNGKKNIYTHKKAGS